MQLTAVRAPRDSPTRCPRKTRSMLNVSDVLSAVEISGFFKATPFRPFPRSPFVTCIILAPHRPATCLSLACSSGATSHPAAAGNLTQEDFQASAKAYATLRGAERRRKWRKMGTWSMFVFNGTCQIVICKG